MDNQSPTYKPSFEFRYLEKGSASVILTPDDILTLKLLRDDYANWLNQNRRSYKPESQRVYETLERILKQVG